MYHYSCQILRVIDGDTVEANIDLGFNCWYRSAVRLKGIQAPELTGSSHKEGIASKEYLGKLVLREPIEIRTELRKDKDKYGRVLGMLYAGGVDVNAAMLDAGHAVEYLK